MPTMPRTLKHSDAPPTADSRESSRLIPEEQAMALVGAAQDGDMDAFGELYRIYRNTVFRYIYYRVSTHALAEDITSETFVRALRRITTFSWQGRDFGAWLVTIARNLITDHFKSSRYRAEVCTGETLDPGEVQESPEESVLAYLFNIDLMQALLQLNDSQRECVTLRFLRGFNLAETAAAMGKDTGAIKTLQWRAVRTLGRHLENAGYDPDMALAA